MSSLVAALTLAMGAALGQAPDGAALFSRHCARCHGADQSGWAPRREELAKLPPEAILGNLHMGFMNLMATLTDAEKMALAAYLTGKPVEPFQMPAPPAPEGFCAEGSSAAADLLSGVGWNGWGADPANSRFQPAEMAGLTADQVPRLKLKWAFGFPLAPAAWSQPVVMGGRVFVGSINGAVYSLDARTGCTYWIYQASPAGVRSAISIGPGSGATRFVAYFGDLTATVHAVDAITGKGLWKAKVDDHPLARITGAPQLYEGRLYVPVASLEEAASGNPKYECCTFRGSLVALDAGSGRQIWKTYMIPEEPRRTRRTPGGTQLWGPSGAGIWSAPAIDRKRGFLYVGTGDNYSDPEGGYTDAVVAIEMASGKIVWGRQVQKGDRWNLACISGDKVTCPKGGGPDFDFGASPILHTLSNGRQVILAGQKSGVLHILDPDQQGAELRQIRVGKGGVLGGIEWGFAADGEKAYVTVSDLDWNHPEAGGGLTAVQIATGEKVWHVAPPRPACLGEHGCSAAQPSAVTAIPGVVFSGSLDGHLRAYAAGDGKLLFDLDTRKPFATVNKVAAQGGSLDAAGPTVAGGMLFVNSGYGFLGGAPGNVLLAFTVEGR
jgi:polyvinyl alcohol dehydrogenase (cytochrome)